VKKVSCLRARMTIFLSRARMTIFGRREFFIKTGAGKFL
jgi:hypothetical protein